MTQKFITAVTAAVIATAAHAAVKLPALLSDNMVLQQQSQARLWGTATPGATVTVSPGWPGAAPVSTKAAKDGAWQLTAATPQASATPYSITITEGTDSITLSNVLIGEVWYCSGQSNMEQPLKGYLCQPVDDALETVLKARPERPIRTFTVPHSLKAEPQTDVDARWRLNEPDAVAYTSAVAYFFADCINDALDIPVGIITSSWGGTQVQGWMSQQALSEAGIDTPHLGHGKPDPQSPYTPGAMYNGMVAPLVPYTVKGMLWYQGEANVYDHLLYERLMQIFVPDMRERFQNPDMPFYYVQIAPHRSVYRGKLEGKAGNLRLAQARLMKQVPNTGMVVTTDLGEHDNIHHTDKRTVGRRLAYWALVKDYGIYNTDKVACTGPVFREMKTENGRAYLYFDNSFGGVAPYGIAIEGFELAGPDGVYHPATGYADPSRSDGRVVRLECPAVAVPVKARYAHGDYNPGTLTDIWGLPASPFTTSGEYE